MDIEIKEVYKIDKIAQKLLKDLIVKKENGFILYNRVIYILAKIRIRVIKGHYSSIVERYLKISSTIERI
jgi:hypothetical protein